MVLTTLIGSMGTWHLDSSGLFLRHERPKPRFRLIKVSREQASTTGRGYLNDHEYQVVQLINEIEHMLQVDASRVLCSRGGSTESVDKALISMIYIT